MPLEHVLTDVDSLPLLALKYLGDASRASEIADYNNLSYPYLVQDRAYLWNYFGSGYITAIRSSVENPLVLKKGWTFKTKPSLVTGGVVKTFKIIEDMVVPAGVQTCYIPLRCTLLGSFGNVTENTITEVGEDTALLSGAQFLSIRNEAKFTGGRFLDVLPTGSTIYIPTDSSEVVSENMDRVLELIGGEDLILDPNGNLVFEVGGDLASASGADNIRYAVADRLKAGLGSILQHSEYGTDYEELIGSPNLANRERLIEIAIYQSLAQEDRITEVSVNSLTVSGTTISLYITYKVAISGMLDELKLMV